MRRLVADQFPRWADLPVRAVPVSGWDNQTFRLGEDLSVRLPTAREYALAVDKEHRWLPTLAPRVPLPIPVPVARGVPADGYGMHWSVYEWIDGEPARIDSIGNLTGFADDLAAFLVALRRVDATGGPASRGRPSGSAARRASRWRSRLRRCCTIRAVVWWRWAECPVRPVEQDWIERSMDWFLVEFGTQRLHGEVVLPNDDYFPGVYQGSHGDVRAVVDRLCEHMGIDPARVELEHYPHEVPELSAHIPMYTESAGAAGHHRTREGRSVIGIRDDLAHRPMALVATIAHELGHALLLGDGRISAEREDHEPLTDLLTIFFGLGVFAANAAFEYGRKVRGDYTFTQATRLGYLTEPMYGYGLARYAWLRGEADPAWARYLDTNPRTLLKRGLRYLARVPPTI